MNKPNGIATLGELHNNDARARAVIDLAQANERINDLCKNVNDLSRQLAAVRQELERSREESQALSGKLFSVVAQRDELKAKYDAATAHPPETMSNDERDALHAVIDMERADYRTFQQAILRAAVDAAEEVTQHPLPEKKQDRATKQYNRGVMMGARAVEAAIARVVTNTPAKEPVHG